MLDLYYPESRDEVGVLEVPPHLEGVVFEFMRLTDEAADHLVHGRLFPCLSTITGLLPVVGFIRDFCVAEVIPNLNAFEADLPQDDLAGAGLYL